MNSFSIDVTTASFQQDVIDASVTVPVLVDFWAEWCGPCKVLKPLLEKLAVEYAGRFILAKVNSDENPELAGHFGIRSIPTVAAFVGGEVVDGFTGAKTEGQLREFLAKLIPDALAEEAVEAEAEPNAEDPRFNETIELLTAGQFDQAKAVILQLINTYGQTDEVDALLGRFNLEKRKLEASASLAEMETRLNTAPDNHQLRLELADTYTSIQSYRQALEHLLISVKKDKQWNEGAARKGMLKVFELMSGNEELMPLVREFRTKLAGVLN